MEDGEWRKAVRGGECCRRCIHNTCLYFFIPSTQSSCILLMVKK